MSDQLFSQKWALCGIIDPDNYAPGTQLTAAIDMKYYEQIAVILLLGDRASGSTIDLAVQSSSTSGGTYATISGKSITQIVDTSPLSGASNLQEVVHVRSGEVTSNNRYVKALLTIGAVSPTANSDVGVLVFGKARYRPATDNDLSTVTVTN